MVTKKTIMKGNFELIFESDDSEAIIDMIIVAESKIVNQNKAIK